MFLRWGKSQNPGLQAVILIWLSITTTQNNKAKPKQASSSVGRSVFFNPIRIDLHELQCFYHKNHLLTQTCEKVKWSAFKGLAPMLRSPGIPVGWSTVPVCLRLWFQWASQVALVVKNPPANAEDVRLGFDPWFGKLPCKGGMATYSSILAWKNLMTEEPGRLQSVESHRIRHDWKQFSMHARIWFQHWKKKKKKTRQLVTESILHSNYRQIK